MRRREFLKTATALPLVGLDRAVAAAQPKKSCILLMLVGGPSHIDTWDPKPDAPSHVRGPFRPIATNVPGIQISEIFPRMARHADKFALIRSVYHDGPAMHETGQQFIQTGCRSVMEEEAPHAGCAVAQSTGSRHVVLPFAIGNTGGAGGHGQSSGHLGPAYEPHFLTGRYDLSGEPESTRAAYGATRFGESCLVARRLVESGVRFVTVNMFETVFGETTWDSHGSQPFSTIADYRHHVAPVFDRAYSALVEDLGQRGLLETTLVVGAGEFGRSPRINPAGGRDHWPQCWTVHMAGGGVQGGQIYGSSDATGAEPKDDPVHAGSIAATMLYALEMRSPQITAPPITRLFA